MTHNQSGPAPNTFMPGAAPATPGASERRRAPRIAPLSADIYSSSSAPRESSLNELKALLARETDKRVLAVGELALRRLERKAKRR